MRVADVATLLAEALPGVGFRAMAHGTRTARASADDAYDVVVVGGGIAGLTAAHALRDRDVLLLEADDRVGGRIYSEPRGDVWLNFGAHVFAGPESASGRLFEELGVEAAPVPGRLAAVSLNGKLVASGPVESFPLRLPLSPALAARARARGTQAPPGGAPLCRRRRRRVPERAQPSGRHACSRSWTTARSPTSPVHCPLCRRALPVDADPVLGDPEELAAGYGVGYFHLVWDRGAGLSRNILGGSAVATGALGAVLAERASSRAARHLAVERVDGGVRVHYADAAGAHLVAARAAVLRHPHT